MKLILILLVAAFFALHQDSWYWHSSEPLLFGLLPPGLWYHALYTIAASGLMAFLVKLTWSPSLDREDPDA